MKEMNYYSDVNHDVHNIAEKVATQKKELVLLSTYFLSS